MRENDRSFVDRLQSAEKDSFHNSHYEQRRSYVPHTQQSVETKDFPSETTESRITPRRVPLDLTPNGGVQATDSELYATLNSVEDSVQTPV